MSDEPRLVQKLSLREKRCHQQEQSTLSTDPESLVQAWGACQVHILYVPVMYSEVFSISKECTP